MNLVNNRVAVAARLSQSDVCEFTTPAEHNTKLCLRSLFVHIIYCPLRGDIRKNWNDTEKISMAPAQG